MAHIDTNWYTSLTDPITENELTETIYKLLNNKVCGLTGISYEILKHSRSTFLTALIALFNYCMLSN